MTATSRPTAEGGSPPAVSHRFLVALCGVMLSLNPISCEVVLPSFLTLEAAFGAARAEVQSIIPLFLLAAGCGQIVFGPLSDRFGRKPLLLVALGIYIAGALAALAAPSLAFVYTARVLQGLGAAGAIVIARAILRDTHAGDDFGRAMAAATGIFTVGPMFAPLIGVIALWLGGWRGPFVAMALIGVALLATNALHLGETLATPDPDATAPARLRTAMKQLFASVQTRHFLLVLILAQGIITVFIATAPHLFRSQFGVEGGRFAFYFALAASGIFFGQLLNTRLIARYGLHEATRTAANLVAVSAVATAIAAPHVSIVPYALLLFFFNLTFLIIVANAMTLAIEPHRPIAGTAAAAIGFLMQVLGNGAALLLLPRLDGGIAGWAVLHGGLLLALAMLVRVFRPVT